MTTEKAMPFVPPPPELEQWGFAAFYIMAATIARSSPTTDATILASRLQLLKESYREHILPTRLAPSGSHRPVVPPRASDSTRPDMP